MSIHTLSANHGPRRRMGSRPEQALQKRIVDYVRYAMTFKGKPLTEWLFHVPNGGKRSPIEAAIFRSLGVKAGVPDLVIPIAAGGYGGLWMELKTETRQLTDLQLDYHQRLREGGQKVVTCREFDDAVNQIVGYLQGPDFVLRDASRPPVVPMCTATL